MSLDVYVGGPNIGETTILVYDAREVIVIDAPLFKKKPLPKYLLQKLGLTKINLLALTHTHSDHVSGAPMLIDEFSPESFIAFHTAASPYWGAFLKLHQQGKLQLSHQDLDELKSFQQLIIKLREAKNRLDSDDFVAACDGQQLNSKLIKRIKSAGVKFDIRILAPAPKILDPILEKIQTDNSPQTFWSSANERNPHPNHFCSCIEVTFNEDVMYFLADATSNAVIDITTKMASKINLLKISHHGSKEGNPQEFWDMSGPKVEHAVSTRFNVHDLPDASVLAMIKSKLNTPEKLSVSPAANYIIKKQKISGTKAAEIKVPMDQVYFLKYTLTGNGSIPMPTIINC